LITFSAGSPVYSIETFPQRQLPDAMIDVNVVIGIALCVVRCDRSFVVCSSFVFGWLFWVAALFPVI
jgi:hypothetical protein